MKITFLIITALMMVGCSTMQPPRYQMSTDNNQLLKQLPNIKGEFITLTQAKKFSPACRLMGPIEPADGLSFPAFITKAFNDELKMADKFAKNGVKITGDITKIQFSSISGLINGYWDISLALRSSNGHVLSVSNKYKFKSGYDAITACNATADALTPAVQDLIKATIQDPKFAELMQAK